MGLPGLKCGKRFSGTATSAPLFGFPPGLPRLVLTVNAPMPRRTVQIGDVNDAVRASQRRLYRGVNEIPPWATMNDEKRFVIVPAPIASRRHHRGMVRETWSLPATHDSQMSANIFLLITLLKGLRREKH